MVHATQSFAATVLIAAFLLAVDLASVSADGGTRTIAVGSSSQTTPLVVSPPPGLVIDCDACPCIANVSSTVDHANDASGVYGWYLDLTWTTSRNAGAIIAVSRQPAISDVDGNEFAQVDGAAIQLVRTGPDHAARIPHLEAASYYFIIEAIGANGQKTKYHGYYHFYASL